VSIPSELHRCDLEGLFHPPSITIGAHLGEHSTMKMSKADIELWHASLIEQWEAKRADDQGRADA
jgi:hypothetical protein